MDQMTNAFINVIFMGNHSFPAWTLSSFLKTCYSSSPKSSVVPSPSLFASGEGVHSLTTAQFMRPGCTHGELLLSEKEQKTLLHFFS
jgi:hypothetical protein